MSNDEHYYFQLFVARAAPNSTQAIANLNALCRAHLSGRHTIEVIDVFTYPERALSDGIFMTPTLIKTSPKPVCRVVGTLNRIDTVLELLGLEHTNS